MISSIWFGRPLQKHLTLLGLLIVPVRYNHIYTQANICDLKWVNLCTYCMWHPLCDWYFLLLVVLLEIWKDNKSKSISQLKISKLLRIQIQRENLAMLIIQPNKKFKLWGHSNETIKLALLDSIQMDIICTFPLQIIIR